MGSSTALHLIRSGYTPLMILLRSYPADCKDGIGYTSRTVMFDGVYPERIRFNPPKRTARSIATTWLIREKAQRLSLSGEVAQWSWGGGKRQFIEPLLTEAIKANHDGLHMSDVSPEIPQGRLLQHGSFARKHKDCHCRGRWHNGIFNRATPLAVRLGGLNKVLGRGETTIY
jgi:hypothetical protein